MDVVVEATSTSPALVLHVSVPDGWFQRKINSSKISKEHQLGKHFQEFELHKKMMNEHCEQFFRDPLNNFSRASKRCEICVVKSLESQSGGFILLISFKLYSFLSP